MEANQENQQGDENQNNGPALPVLPVQGNTNRVTAEESIWVNMLQEGTIGDIMPCLAIARALKKDQVSGGDTVTNFE